MRSSENKLMSTHRMQLKKYLCSAALPPTWMLYESPGDLIKMKILIQLLWCDLRFCISYQLSGDTTAAGPWATLGVARG